MQLQQQTTRRPTTNVSPVKGQKNTKLSSTVMGNRTSLLLAAQWQPQAEHSSAIRAVRQFKSLDSCARTSLFDEELEHHVRNVVSEVQHAFVHASTKEITWTAHYIFFCCCPCHQKLCLADDVRDSPIPNPLPYPQPTVAVCFRAELRVATSALDKNGLCFSSFLVLSSRIMPFLHLLLSCVFVCAEYLCNMLNKWTAVAFFY